MAPLIAECPRGSFISSSRTSSRCSMKCRRRSFMVAPGMVPRPAVTTRVGMPSVCESTAVNILEARMSAAQCFDGPLGLGLDQGAVLRGERAPRRAARTAVAPDQVHAELDGLHELRTGIPAEHGHQVFVQV